MKGKNACYILAFVFLALATSCGHRKVRTDGYTPLPPSSGAVMEIVAVVDSSLLTDRVKAALYRRLSPVTAGLPLKERQGRLYIIPRESFSRTYRTMRNLVLIETSDSLSGASSDRDVFATPQNVFYLRAPDENQMLEQIGRSGDSIFRAIRQGALEALQEKFARIPSKKLKTVSGMGVEIDIPNYYHVARNEKDFVWLTRDISKNGVKGSVNLMIYRNDSIKDPVALRDSVSRRYVPGITQGSYMETEKTAVRPHHENGTLPSGSPAVFTHGYWRMHNDFMGGPFLNYSLTDKSTGTIYCADGFVYLPFEEKASFMLELEAILRTFRTGSPSQ